MKKTILTALFSALRDDDIVAFRRAGHAAKGTVTLLRREDSPKMTLK